MAMGCGVALAQTTTTPYSKMGYGMLNDNVSSIQRSMGGVGYAMKGGRIINVMNPASYSNVDSLTFLWDVGIDLTNLWSKENDNTGYSFSGGLDYLTGHFKVAKGAGVAFGLLPYSSVGYAYGGTINGGSESRSGSGGFNQLFVGVGYEPVKNLSAGLNFSYLFGTTSNTTLITSTSSSYFTRIMKLRDWNLQLGLQYSLSLNKGHDVFTLGATYQPKKSFHGNTWGTKFDTQDNKVDTIGYTSMKGNYEQPASIGAGLSYTMDRRLTIEADYTFQKWSGAKYMPIGGFEPQTMQFDDRWRIATGVQYTPNRRGSYFGAMAFRAGVFYNHDYLNYNGNNVRDYGASIGLGFPALAGDRTTVNLGFEWRHRTSSPVKLITENYFNITLGVNFNESWFWKNRIR
jgi:long-subunit fatty acid transport protein